MQLSQAITREYFASSVYRNILDMIATCETIRKDLRASMLTIARAGSRYCVGRQCAYARKQGTLVWPGSAANGYAIAQGARSPNNDRFSWFYLLHKKLGMKYAYGDYNAYSVMLSEPGQANKAVFNARTQSLDLKARIRNIEWELNRVHLPMVEDLRASLVQMDKYVSDLPTSMGGDNSASADRGRIASYSAILYLDKMKGWLATMTEKIEIRQKEDAAGLATIAAEKEKAAAQAAAAGEVKTAIVEKQAAAQVQAAAVEAAETADQAAATTQKIEKPDQPVETKGRAILTVGAAAAALYFLM